MKTIKWKLKKKGQETQHIDTYIHTHICIYKHTVDNNEESKTIQMIKVAQIKVIYLSNVMRMSVDSPMF